MSDFGLGIEELPFNLDTNCLECARGLVQICLGVLVTGFVSYPFTDQLVNSRLDCDEVGFPSVLSIKLVAFGVYIALIQNCPGKEFHSGIQTGPGRLTAPYAGRWDWLMFISFYDILKGVTAFLQCSDSTHGFFVLKEGDFLHRHP